MASQEITSGCIPWCLMVILLFYVVCVSSYPMELHIECMKILVIIFFCWYMTILPPWCFWLVFGRCHIQIKYFDTDCPDIFCRFPPFYQAHSGIYHKSGQYCFFAHLFLFIIYWSYRYLVLHSLRYSVLKIKVLCWGHCTLIYFPAHCRTDLASLLGLIIVSTWSLCVRSAH